MTQKDLENYFKLGMILACAQKCNEVLNFDFPSIFWKYLMFQDLEWDDIKVINVNIHVCVEKIEQMPESDLEYLDENFITFLLDGSEIELKPNGRNITLTAENKYEYLSLIKEKNFTQFLPAYKAMRDGFYHFAANETNCKFLTPQTFEQKLCGMNYVDIELLKRNTKYGKFDKDHPAAKRFWRVLKTFNQRQLAGYLKFVWGRTRLTFGSNDQHTLTFMPGKNFIPEAHTCFFELDLGEYQTDAELRKKLLYGIENCGEIAESTSTYGLTADFGL
jgi:hypothetical protein